LADGDGELTPAWGEDRVDDWFSLDGGAGLVQRTLPISLRCEPVPSYSRSGFSEAILEKLEVLATSSVAGGTLLGIWTSDRVYISARGLADRSTKTPLSPHHQFRAGSFTKALTGTIVLQLVQEGRIALTDTLAMYAQPRHGNSHIPAIKDADRITIQMVLSHTSGIADYTRIPWVAFEIMNHRFRTWRPQELVQAAIDYGPVFRPGAQFAYSNTNSIVAGMLVEQLTQHDYEHEITRRIFQPLSRKRTEMPTGVSLTPPFCCGYVISAGTAADDWTERDPSMAWAAGGVISTLEDLRQLTRALTDGTYLCADLQRLRLQCWEALSAGKPDFPSFRYGLSLMTYGGFVGHSGGAIGYRCIAMHHPEKETTIVIVSNSEPGRRVQDVLKDVVGVVHPEIHM